MPNHSHSPKHQGIEVYYSEKQWEEALTLLRERWEKNNLDIGILKNKTVLDIGCGSGRYSFALKRMGAKPVMGIDTDKRNKIWPDDIQYKQCAITKLPFDDDSFDFVFCNGRLSHTKHWKKGLKEATRVLRPKGWLWLSLYGEGKVWRFADRLRDKLTKRDAADFQQYLLLRDWEPHKIAFLLDAFFAPVRIYFTKAQIESHLLTLGLSNITTLRRGTTTDLNEKIFHDPELRAVYGEGELRLVAQKLA